MNHDKSNLTNILKSILSYSYKEQKNKQIKREKQNMKLTIILKEKEKTTKQLLESEFFFFIHLGHQIAIDKNRIHKH